MSVLQICLNPFNWNTILIKRQKWQQIRVVDNCIGQQCRQYKAMLGIQAIRDILRETRPVESVMMLRHPFLQESIQNKIQVDYICLQRKPVVTDS